MNRVVGSVILAIAIATPAAIAAQQQSKIAYPPTKTINHVDDYFGRKIADPYRWMEDLNAADVTQWVKAQNGVTEKFLATLPMRERFRSRITELGTILRSACRFAKPIAFSTRRTPACKSSPSTTCARRSMRLSKSSSIRTFSCRTDPSR